MHLLFNYVLKSGNCLINIQCTLLSQPFSYLSMYCSWCFNSYRSFNAITKFPILLKLKPCFSI